MGQGSDATTVHILMAVFNGADHLQGQLDSFDAQTHSDWHLIASDDGSQDDSTDILRKYAQGERAVDVLHGPCLGGAANFMFLLRHLATKQPVAGCIAFADQDDKWLPHKLARALDHLEGTDPERPALYCSRSLIAGPDLSAPRLSAPRPKPPGFRNALVQNIAGGNTIVLNRAASALVLKAAPHVDEVVVHDWWVYQLVTGAGGVVLHDDEPGLLYRQHDANQIGANDTTRARLLRIAMLLRGDFRAWNDVNIAALRANEKLLSADNRTVLQSFDRMRRLPLLRRLYTVQRLGLYRQTRASTAALWIAAVLRRI
ncbi:glycosyl transferase [Tateyamaria omphalii]|uniref:glycosyltransferase n=1 Tax=Tateyamaria omphalii TaxID=299262 RepID=UPI001677203F|nr:glycosyltransferase [Tateyamaria omphalii]GGX70551.1 glycosyl transferase [Tateyamaria omphalii]